MFLGVAAEAAASGFDASTTQLIAYARRTDPSCEERALELLANALSRTHSVAPAVPPPSVPAIKIIPPPPAPSRPKEPPPPPTRRPSNPPNTLPNTLPKPTNFVPPIVVPPPSARIPPPPSTSPYGVFAGDGSNVSAAPIPLERRIRDGERTEPLPVEAAAPPPAESSDDVLDLADTTELPALGPLNPLGPRPSPEPPPSSQAGANIASRLGELAKEALLSGDNVSLERWAASLQASGESPVFTERMRAMARIVRGDIGDALRVLRRTRSALDPTDHALRCQTSLALGIALSVAGRPQDALLEGLDALARARQIGDPRAALACLAFLAKLFQSTGRAEEAARLRELTA